MAPSRPISLITGASSGIGIALAHEFAAHRHELVLIARREAPLVALAEEIVELGAPRPHLLTIDLTERNACDRIAGALAERGLAPAYLVNNAGLGLFGEVVDLDLTAQLTMIDLNVRALTDLTLRFIDSLARHRGGILNVASLAAYVPGPRMAVYHATKAYVLSLSEALHRELRPLGITVTALCPGPVVTEFQERSGMAENLYPRLLSRTAGRVAEDGYDGLMRGRRVVIPGSHNKLTAMLLRMLPRGGAYALARASQRG
jgi:uncharacterized protein